MHKLCYIMEQQYLPHILQDQTLVSGAQDLSIIRHHTHLSLLCLCGNVKWNAYLPTFHKTLEWDFVRGDQNYAAHAASQVGGSDIRELELIWCLYPAFWWFVGRPKAVDRGSLLRWTILVTFCEADLAEGPPPPGNFGLSRCDFLHSSGFLGGLIKMCIMFGIMTCRAF